MWEWQRRRIGNRSCTTLTIRMKSKLIRSQRFNSFLPNPNPNQMEAVAMRCARLPGIQVWQARRNDRKGRSETHVSMYRIELRGVGVCGSVAIANDDAMLAKTTLEATVGPGVASYIGVDIRNG